MRVEQFDCAVPKDAGDDGTRNEPDRCSCVPSARNSCNGDRCSRRGVSNEYSVQQQQPSRSFRRTSQLSARRMENSGAGSSIAARPSPD